MQRCTSAGYLYVQANKDSSMVQDEKLKEVENRLKTSLGADINQEQDEKLKQLDSKLRKVIQQVASAPVEVNLSDDAKKAIVADLERRVSLLEAPA